MTRAYSDLGVRDAEITAHANFRKRLYDHDVMKDAKAAVRAERGPSFALHAPVTAPP